MGIKAFLVIVWCGYGRMGNPGRKTRNCFSYSEINVIFKIIILTSQLQDRSSRGESLPCFLSPPNFLSSGGTEVTLESPAQEARRRRE